MYANVCNVYKMYVKDNIKIGTKILLSIITA